MIGYGLIVFLLAFVIMYMSRPCLYVVLRWKTERRLRGLGVKLHDIHFSFEEMTYFVPLPNRLPLLANATLDQLVAEPDYTSFIFPKLNGLKIYVRKEKEELLIAYISIEHFRLPYFDKLLYEGKINERQYLEMSAYKLMHRSTSDDFLKEVYRMMSA
ncbi:hypothetical protein [Halalkalibacter urbisdiaboli]|uniref:hypothetical protein n=1 Tax=Halalkalibacter urbisdiaboli TaxID=1960589 RepID=UPI000B452C40|nr:hypothetical protein [Halalkalibacter urbisdiaboli]